MPLGLMPGMSYEEKETLLQAGEAALLYSDGLVEAHGACHEAGEELGRQATSENSVPANFRERLVYGVRAQRCNIAHPRSNA
jgi:serine phosphatase RsbU (regulator of sigma subunit)